MEPMEGEIFPGMGVIHGKDGKFSFLLGNPYLFVVFLLDALEKIVRKSENGVHAVERNMAGEHAFQYPVTSWSGR